LRNQITFRLTGNYALFTDPITKIGGEKSTLMLPTYQALKGICESIYWKPTIIWIVDKVCIVNPIKTESKGIRPLVYSGGNDLAYYTYLSNVEYIVSAHFEFNKNRPDLQNDWNENKHYFISKRCLEKGGRRDIFLGVRECQGYIEPCEFTNESSCYLKTDLLEFGLQYHSLSYPDENGKDELIAKFWNPCMKNGVIEFCRPEDCPKERVIRKMEMKTFDDSNFSGTQEDGLLDGYKEGD
jgi:CRISPR-associated protein Cas5d